MKKVAIIFALGWVTAFVGGFKAQQIYAFFARPDYCPKSASIRALQGCEVIAASLEKEVEDHLWTIEKCNAREDACNKTVECMLKPSGCRSPSADEVKDGTGK